MKIIIILLYAPLCFACPLPLAWFLNAPWGTKCEHKLLGRRDRTRMVEWIMGLSSDFERALERSPERRLWFSYLPNTFLHVPCGWLVEHHNLPSSVCLATSMLCNWYAWHSHTMGHVWKLVPWCWFTRKVSMLTHPDSLGQLAPSHQLLSPKWNCDFSTFVNSITRKGNVKWVCELSYFPLWLV